MGYHKDKTEKLFLSSQQLAVSVSSPSVFPVRQIWQCRYTVHVQLLQSDISGCSETVLHSVSDRKRIISTAALNYKNFIQSGTEEQSDQPRSKKQTVLVYRIHGCVESSLLIGQWQHSVLIRDSGRPIINPQNEQRHSTCYSIRKHQGRFF